MCMLTFFPPSAPVDEQALRNGSVVNNDGHGWAVIDGGGLLIHTGHSMDFEEALTGFLDARAAHPDTDALFHSRITTHGSTNLDNCHPFRVPGVRDTVVGHNGILPCHPVHPLKDRRSDTRLFAEDILMRRFPALDSPKTQQRLTTWMGWSKILILTVDPRFKKSAYLFGELSGEWVKGVWYSNSGYLPKTPWRQQAGTYFVKNKETGEWEERGYSEYSWTSGAGYSYPEKSSTVEEATGEFADTVSDVFDSWDSYVSSPRGRGSYGWDASAEALTFAADGREGAVLGPREPGAEFTPGMWQCPDRHCQSYNIDAELGFCLACNGCLECAFDVRDCECPDGEASTERVTSWLRDAGIEASETTVKVARDLTYEQIKAVGKRVREITDGVGWPKAVEAVKSSFVTAEARSLAVGALGAAAPMRAITAAADTEGGA